jgi:ABC-2 type transport system ATP-binding protein
MRRRLNIATSVLHTPPVLLLDEPTVGVDPQSRERIFEMLRTLRAQGTALLYTTHQLDEAEQVASRIVIIDRGRTVAEGTFEALLHQTIGPRRRVVFQVEGVDPMVLRGLGFDLPAPGAASRSIDDPARDLPALFAQLAAAGATVRDLALQAPSLQAVFLHLTGRELRE